MDNAYSFKKIDDEKVAIPLRDDAFSILQNQTNLLNGMELNFDRIPMPSSKKKVISPYGKMFIALKTLWISKFGVEEWTKTISAEIPSSWEVHGDLVMFNGKAFIDDNWTQLGNDLWVTVAKCLSCSRIAKSIKVNSGGFRTPCVKLLYGDHGKVEQVDNKIKYSYDVTKCMFSSGNITEKLRIARFDCSGEVVVDMYAGIGYFTLPYLVHAKAAHVHACEWNEDAVDALRNNLLLNGVTDKATIYAGDNRKVCPQNIADRVNLGIIPSSQFGWSTACRALKSDSGGILHIHENLNSKYNNDNNHIQGLENMTDLTDAKLREESFKQIFLEKHQCYFPICLSNISNIHFSWLLWAKKCLRELTELFLDIHKQSWQCYVIHIEHVKSYAPHIDHIVLDVKCLPQLM